LKKIDLRFLSGKWRKIRETDNIETVVRRMREMGIAGFHWKCKLRAFDTGNVRERMGNCRQTGGE